MLKMYANTEKVRKRANSWLTHSLTLVHIQASWLVFVIFTDGLLNSGPYLMYVCSLPLVSNNEFVYLFVLAATSTITEPSLLQISMFSSRQSLQYVH